MIKPFSDTETGTPHKWEDGWYVATYPPLGTETLHGPYRTRKRARWAQHGLKERNKNSRFRYERTWRAIA